MRIYYLDKESIIEYCKPSVLYETNGRKIDNDDKNVVMFISEDNTLPEYLCYDPELDNVYIPDRYELEKRGIIIKGGL